MKKRRQDLLIYDVAKRLQDERAVAMKCLAAVLTDANENIRRDDLVASINDLAHRLTMQLPKPET